MNSFEDRLTNYPSLLESYTKARIIARENSLKGDDLDHHLSKYCMAWFFENHLRVEREASDQELRQVTASPIVPFIMSDVQLGILDKFTLRMKEKKKFRHRVMKCRRARVSTIYLAISYHLARFNESKKGLIFCDRLETARKLRRILEIFYQSDDLKDKPTEGRKTLGEGLYLHPTKIAKEINDRDSFILLGSGEQKNAGVGGSLDWLVWCIDVNTLVETIDGRMILAKDCKGESVITHNGKIAKVVDVSVPWKSSKSIKIEIGNNSSFPVVCTLNHKFWISKTGSDPEWIEAQDIGFGDYSVLPIKEIKNRINHLSVPDVFIQKKSQPLNKSNELMIDVNFDLGRMVGLYLSEGYIKRGIENPSGVCFCCHQKEVKDWSDYLGKSCHFFGSDIKPTNGSGLRSYVSIYSRQLAVFLWSNFGEKNNKFIPHWVFECGRDFLRGIVFGYIKGDGFLDESMISISSIRASTVFQIREIVLSLYGGYGTMRYRKAGNFYGRNCSGIFILNLCGIANLKIRQDFGWPHQIPSKKGSKQNWFIRDEHLFVKVLSTQEINDQIEVCDLILDHEDHSFKLPGVVSHNSEAALTSDAEIHMTTISPSLQGALFDVAESTPSLVGQDAIIYPEFEHPSENCDLMFVSWLDIKEYRIDDEEKVKNYIPYNDHNLYGKEEEIINDRKVSVQQMLWRRLKLDELKNLNSFRQVFPIDKEEAFYSSAGLFFHKTLMEMTKPKVLLQSKQYLFSDQGAEIAAILDPTGPWKIYEPTIIDRGYLIAVDIAEGKCADKESRDPDYSVATVFKLNPVIEEVAFFRERIPPEILAEQVAIAAKYYNGAFVVPERNGPGLAFLVRILQIYNNVYQQQKFINGSFVMTQEYGFQTTSTTKVHALSCLLSRIRDKDKGLTLHTDIFRNEMARYVQQGMKYGALPGFHDDTITVLWLMAVSIGQSPNMIRPRDSDGQPPPNMRTYEPKIQRDDWAVNLGKPYYAK